MSLVEIEPGPSKAPVTSPDPETTPTLPAQRQASLLSISVGHTRPYIPFFTFTASLRSFTLLLFQLYTLLNNS